MGRSPAASARPGGRVVEFMAAFLLLQ